MHFAVLVYLPVVWFATAAFASRDCKLEQNFPAGEQFQRLCLPEWAANRSYSDSITAPIATALNKQPGAVDALSQILDHVKREHKRVYDAWRAPKKQFVISSEDPCNIKTNSPVESVQNQLSWYGLGLLNNTCTTELKTPIKDTPIDAMKHYLRSIDKVTVPVSRKAGYARWKKPSSFNLFPYKSSADTCTVHHYAAFRNLNGVWGINTGITNDLIHLYLEDWHRQYLVEILYVDKKKKKIRPVPMMLRMPPKVPYVKDAPLNTTWRKSSTVIITWGGVPTSSLFTPLFNAANNPAVVAAIAKGEHTRQQVEDATTPAGLAILIAPLFFTAIPVAFIAEIETVGILVYTIATDVLTVLPLLIKGIELISYGAIKKEAVRTWVYGGLTSSEAAALETWYCSCEANDRVVILGRVFIVMAFVFMAVGVGLEIIAAKHMKKNKTIMDFLMPNRKREHAWHEAVCVECECARLGVGQIKLYRHH